MSPHLWTLMELAGLVWAFGFVLSRPRVTTVSFASVWRALVELAIAIGPYLALCYYRHGAGGPMGNAYFRAVIVVAGAEQIPRSPSDPHRKPAFGYVWAVAAVLSALVTPGVFGVPLALAGAATTVGLMVLHALGRVKPGTAQRWCGAIALCLMLALTLAEHIDRPM